MKALPHRVQLYAGPLPGVHAVLMHSARGFGRHWHDSFGFGVMDEGAHRTASGRGPVLAVAGQVIATNPGEVHDGVPMGGQARRWRMVHLSPQAMASVADLRPGHEITRPVFDDPRLQAAIQRVFQCWAPNAGALDRALWEEALTQACGLLLQGHGNRPAPETTARLHHSGLARARECLLDGLERPRSALGLGAFLLILVAALLAAGAVWWKASHPWVDPVDPRAADPMHAIGARG